MRQLAYRLLTTFLQLIIFGNGYIALCAVVMCQTTVRLFNLRLPGSFLPFVFAGTLGSYSLHSYLTEASIANSAAVRSSRELWIEGHKRTLLFLTVSAVLAGLWLLLRLQTYLIDLLPVVFLTFLYTAPKIDWRPFRALRRIAVLKTAYLALVWTYMTVVVPLLIATPVGGINETLVGAWILNRFLLIYSVALWFDYRDRDDDRQSKWLTIVSMLTEKQVRSFVNGIALCFGLTLVVLYWQGLSEWVIFCLSLPMILLLFTACRVVNYRSDYGYYVYLDTLLMLSGILLTFGPKP